jgi:ABC-type nitrate/sulfonate/bicarbonate transport systems, periplasmic components
MKKRKTIITAALLTAMAISMSAYAGSAAAPAAGKYSGTVKLGMSSWIGYAPLYVAAQKGFFKKEGANVQIETIQSAGDRKTALAANRIQGMASTVDTHVMTKAAGIDITQVLALDTSSGGDGVVSKKTIQNLKALKGKTVALDTTGGASYFWFAYLLQQQGMSMSDMNIVNMSAGDAGAAFVAGKVDAAVTWQPWLTKAESTSFGKVLVSSKSTPGIIVDSLGLRADFVKSYPKTVQAIVDGWYDALKYDKTNASDANGIMAKAMGESKSDFVSQLGDVKFYDKAGNITYFGTASKKGLIYSVSQKAADLWYKIKLISAKPNVGTMINGSFVGK